MFEWMAYLGDTVSQINKVDELLSFFQNQTCTFHVCDMRTLVGVNAVKATALIGVQTGYLF